MSPTRIFATRTIITALAATMTFAIVGVAFVSEPTLVQAHPIYAEKEQINCVYCHNNPQVGGSRNYRGRFYRDNNNSFAGFDDEAEAKAADVDVAPEAAPKPKSWTPPGTTVPTAPTPAVSPLSAAPKPSRDGLKKAVDETAAALKKAPKDLEAKKAHAASLTALAHGLMGDTDIPPAKRYPDALILLRKAVVLDPTNKDASSAKKMIEDAYKSAGKPLPK